MPTQRTDQEIYDFVKTQLITQGGPSYEFNTCEYRGPNGRRCAAGWLLDDDSEFQEGKDISNPVNKTALRKSGVEDRQIPLVDALQAAHDGRGMAVMFAENRTIGLNDAIFNLEITARLRAVAGYFNLIP